METVKLVIRVQRYSQAGGGQASWQNPQEVRSYQATGEWLVIDCFENSGKFRISSFLKEMECAISFTQN